MMLPFFHSVHEARQFIECVAGRAQPVLLVETRESAEQLSQLVKLPGLSEVHLGLNDLSISRGCRFLFDLISDGTVSELCRILREASIPFGFGGIGSLSRTDLPVSPELVLAYQIYEGATRGWLGRTFRETPCSRLRIEIGRLRDRVKYWQTASDSRYQQMQAMLISQINAASRSCSGDSRSGSSTDKPSASAA